MTQEQIVDNIILNEIELKNPGFKDLVLPKTTKESKRTAILSILDDDRKLFERYKNIVKSEEVCGHYAEEIVQVLREYVRVADTEVKEHGEVMTPLTLVNEMLDKLPNETWSSVKVEKPFQYTFMGFLGPMRILDPNQAEIPIGFQFCLHK